MKTPECLLLLLLTNFALYSTVIISEFEQISAVWVYGYIISDNKFAFSNCEKYIVLVTALNRGQHQYN